MVEWRNPKSGENFEKDPIHSRTMNEKTPGGAREEVPGRVVHSTKPSAQLITDQNFSGCVAGPEPD